MSIREVVERAGRGTSAALSSASRRSRRGGERLGRVAGSIGRRCGRAFGQAGRDFVGVHKALNRARGSCATFDLRVLRGDHIGLIGPNGAGETTLLKLLLGARADAGGCRLGTKLEVAYFDQLRSAARSGRRCPTPRRGLGLGRGRPAGASTCWLSVRFPLSTGSRPRAGTAALGRRAQPAAAGAPLRAARQPAGAGRADQRSRHRDAGAARGHAAGLPGTLLLVTHDRTFLDNVVTSTLAWRATGGRGVRRRLQRLARQRSPATAAGRCRLSVGGAQSRAAAPGTRSRQAVVQGAARARRAAGDARGARAGTTRVDAADERAPTTTRLGADTIKGDRERAQAIERGLAEKLERWGELDARALGFKTLARRRHVFVARTLTLIGRLDRRPARRAYAVPANPDSCPAPSCSRTSPACLPLNRHQRAKPWSTRALPRPRGGRKRPNIKGRRLTLPLAKMTPPLRSSTPEPSMLVKAEALMSTDTPLLTFTATSLSMSMRTGLSRDLGARTRQLHAGVRDPDDALRSRHLDTRVGSRTACRLGSDS